MAVTILDKVLVPDRQRQYASKVGGFATPALHERPVQMGDGPFLVTNMKCQFVPTRRRNEGTVWSGFSECSLESEDLVIQALYTSLWRHSASQGWGNRCRTIAASIIWMRNRGYEPKTLIVPADLLQEACVGDLSAEDIRALMLSQGYLAEVDGVRIFMCPQLPSGSGILAAGPSFVGSYTRVGSALSVSLQQVDRSLTLVGADGVA